MMRPGDRVGVAVSGGADSVALLLLLLELRGKLGIVLSVVHFNHKLRGKASDADEVFVAKLAAKHGLEFHSASVDVAKKAKRSGPTSRTRRGERGTTIFVRWQNREIAGELWWLTLPTIKRRPCLRISFAEQASLGLAESIPSPVRSSVHC